MSNLTMRSEVCQLKKTGVGITQGVLGNGIICNDFDGPNGPQNFKDYLGIALEDLPPTIYCLDIWNST